MNNQSVGKGVKPMKAQLKVQKFMPLICELFKMFFVKPPKTNLRKYRFSTVVGFLREITDHS